MSGASFDEQLSRGPVAGRLGGKVTLVTGAGGGQGREVSILFAQAGALVFASDVNAVTLEETRVEAERRGVAIQTMVVDASSHEQAAAWVDAAVREHGRVDVLYNNGAHVHMAPFAEMTTEQWHETIRLELDVIFMPTKAVWPIMTEQGGGSIINIASGSGLAGAEGLGAAAHAAGNGGVVAVTRQLALEGAPHWIRVNCIAPGPIMGPTLKRLYDADTAFRTLFDSTPMLERHGYPVDIAYPGLFLASDESRFITGITIAVDGGSTSKIGAVSSRLMRGAS
jgi:meso-butanediol dehydrogenase / (S,S)-butanediol dehydrogenase / diacetyl reductase